MWHKQGLHWVSSMLMCLVLLVGCGATPDSPAAVAVAPTPTPPAPTAPLVTEPPAQPTPSPLVYRERFSGKVDVGGYQLKVTCVGKGTPTVVMDAGLGGDSTVWGSVLLDVRKFTRACIYDRAGLGESDPGPKPRTSQQIVTELHTLLQNAGIDGPFVLVGHSFGGMNMWLYASKYRDTVAGLLLVDAAHPDQWDQFPALLPSETPNENRLLHEIRAAWVHPEQNPEGVDINASATQVRAAGTLGDLPLVVLTRGQYLGCACGDQGPVQTSLAGKSEGFPAPLIEQHTDHRGA